MTTRWSRVVRAGDDDEKTAQEALAGLCQDYWRPLYHFARRRGSSPQDAQDLTQGFILRMLEKSTFGRADQERGRFRTFLITTFVQYMMNQHRDQTRQKRGGSQAMLSLDEDDAERQYAAQMQDWLTPERQYERSWALAMLERVMQRLREEYVKAGRLLLFEVIQPHIAGGAGRPGYEGMAATLGMSTTAVTVSMFRMRKRYGQLLREEIGSTVDSPAEVEDELRHLINVLAATPDGA